MAVGSHAAAKWDAAKPQNWPTDALVSRQRVFVEVEPSDRSSAFAYQRSSNAARIDCLSGERDRLAKLIETPRLRRIAPINETAQSPDGT